MKYIKLLIFCSAIILAGIYLQMFRDGGTNSKRRAERAQTSRELNAILSCIESFTTSNKRYPTEFLEFKNDLVSKNIDSWEYFTNSYIYNAPREPEPAISFPVVIERLGRYHYSGNVAHVIELCHAVDIFDESNGGFTSYLKSQNIDPALVKSGPPIKVIIPPQ